MKKITLSLIFFAFVTTASHGQRILEIVSPTMTDLFTEITQDDFVYFSQRGDTKLRRYDGSTYTEYNYPFRDGVQLKFDEYSENLFVFGTNVYVLLRGGTPTAHAKHLYRFDGTSFSPVAFTGNIVSNAVIYRDKIHVMIKNTSGAKLFSYNGSVVSEVASSLMPAIGYYSLQSGLYLYIRGNAGSGGSPDVLNRYDGSTFRTLPAVPTSSNNLSHALQIIGTEKVYLVFDNYSIFYYDGSSMTAIHNVDGINVQSPLLWEDNLYFEAGNNDPGYPRTLYKCSGASKTEISLPAGASLVNVYRMAVYRDNLYLPVETSSGDFIYRYDGAFTSFLHVPGGAGSTSMEVRQGNLVILPATAGGGPSYEYNGTVFTEIRTPADEWFFEIEESARCYHAWTIGYVDLKDFQHKWVLAVEKPKASCPPPGSTTVIPARLQDYEHIVIGPYGRERDWCWTGIDINWEVIPSCPFPCTDPLIQSTMTDKNGKVAWQKTFDKPFSATIPLTDTQPYTLSLAVQKNQTFGDVLVLDKDLVNKGFESVTLDMYPKDGYFYLTTTADKDVQVPFTVTLKNTKGQSLWQESYTAPMDELIHAYIPTAGDYLQFSLQQINVASAVTYYPNPANGKLNIRVENDNEPVRISLTDFNGAVISRKDILSAGEHTLDISNQKAGLYILTIVEGKSTRRELIEVR